MPWYPGIEAVDVRASTSTRSPVPSVALESGRSSAVCCDRVPPITGSTTAHRVSRVSQAKLTRDELVDLVRLILSVPPGSTERDLAELMLQVSANVPHPHWSDLAYYTEPPLSPEEIVDRALAYKPILL